jgi:hypothetical protein
MKTANVQFAEIKDKWCGNKTLMNRWPDTEKNMCVVIIEVDYFGFMVKRKKV